MSKGMKVLLITPIYPPDTGGAATNYKLLVKELVKTEDLGRIVILTRYNFRAPIYQRMDKVSIFRCMFIPRTKGRWKYPVLLGNYAWLLIVIPYLVYLYKIDIIHYHQQFIYRSMEVLSPFLKVPKILDKRDIGEKVPSPGTFDKVISASENIRKLLLSKGIPPEKIVDIPLIFESPSPLSEKEVARLRSRYNLPSHYILFVGDIVGYKGVYELLEAYHRLKMEGIEHGLVLIGHNQEADAFLKKIAGESDIYYLGELRHIDVLGLIQASDLVVLPSKTEGIPRVCLEGIALGRKVLCPPGIIEFQWYLPDFVLNDLSAEGIAGAMRAALLSDKSPHYPLEQHLPAVVMKCYRRLYQDVLTKK